MQRGFFVLKRKTMEVLMAVLFLIAAYCLTRGEGAKLVENINGEKKTVVVDPWARRDGSWKNIGIK